MSIFQALSVIIVLAAISAYINRRFLNLHPSIGVMGVSLGGAMLIFAIDATGWIDLQTPISRLFANLDFANLLLKSMLGVLLFAGAFHVNVDDLLGRKVEIGVFALFGVVATAFITAGAMWAVVQWVGLPLSFIECLLFGALISPTDPIAVLAILERVGGPQRLRTDICGESLFNDGVGVVMFMTVLKVYAGEAVSPGAVVGLFVLEAAGGLLLGIVLGKLAGWLVKSAGDRRVDVLIGLAVATGGYALANAIHCSGPIAMVVAGTLGGRAARRLAKDDRDSMDNFWGMIDELGNMILFAIVGLELLVVTQAIELRTTESLIVAAVAIPVVMGGRMIAIAAPISLLRLKYTFYPHAIKILTWGGLRGGLPLAMALSLPSETPQQAAARDAIIVITYGVVAFSIFVQGLSIAAVVKRALPTEETSPSASTEDN